MKRASTSAARLISAAVLWACAGAAHAQAASPIPYKAASEGRAFDGPQWLLVVAACGAFLGVALYVLRRFGSRLPRAWATPAKRVRVIERTCIAPNTQLVVVEYERRRLLLSVSAGTTVCLRDSDAADAAMPEGGVA